MKDSQTVLALRYAKEKYNKDSLTFRQLVNIRFEMPKSAFYMKEPTYSDEIYAGNLYGEVNRSVNPKIKREKINKLFHYSLVKPNK